MGKQGKGLAKQGNGGARKHSAPAARTVSKLMIINLKCLKLLQGMKTAKELSNRLCSREDLQVQTRTYSVIKARLLTDHSGMKILL